jgi:hypothetical protein
VSVLFLIIDGLPARHVGRTLTPALAGLAAAGWWAPAGGLSVMPSSTYPNHATFVTGHEPSGHGIHANRVVVDGEVRHAAAVGPTGPTIFDACHAAGRSTAAVFGDHHLVHVMGATRAGSHWPPRGEVVAGTPVDGLGYADDDAVAAPLLAALEQAPDLLVAHLNGPDTAGHLYGPDSPEALDQARVTDAVLARVLRALAGRWSEWTVIVVSDHDQETVTVDEPVDLAGAALAAGVDVLVLPEGSAALVAGGGADDGGRWLDGVAGVEGHRAAGPGLRLVWTTPGRYVGSVSSPASGPFLRGIHGGPRQTAQVAVVGGGHPATAGMIAGLPARPPARAWAGEIARLLEISPVCGPARRPPAAARR